MLGRNDADSLYFPIRLEGRGCIYGPWTHVGSVTVIRIEPMSSCVLFVPGINVIVRVVSSDSTRPTIAMSPAPESTRRESEEVDDETVKLALALETVEVDMNKADAVRAI